MCVDRMARGETGPDEEKMMLAFQAFDALIPGLGVYTRIFRKLRDDLFGKLFCQYCFEHLNDITETERKFLFVLPVFFCLNWNVLQE